MNRCFYWGCCFCVKRVHNKKPAVVDHNTTNYRKYHKIQETNVNFNKNVCLDITGRILI